MRRRRRGMMRLIITYIAPLHALRTRRTQAVAFQLACCTHVSAVHRGKKEDSHRQKLHAMVILRLRPLTVKGIPTGAVGRGGMDNVVFTPFSTVNTLTAGAFCASRSLSLSRSLSRSRSRSRSRLYPSSSRSCLYPSSSLSRLYTPPPSSSLSRLYPS